ncbi:MAG: SDR family NAD(P)-dependent oxidoreductase, partial [Sandaracinaceae bacterium]|nr:SDR family NAD(P)-dependent oxidoreductase [Sandaracinaceae bacterium]
LCWEALERAGHDPGRFPGPIGVWAGCGMGSYFYFHLCRNSELLRSVGMFLLRHTGNDKDFLPTRVSYLLNLRGPSIGVQTACSTSLVAVHLACQSLLSREVDMALAGGITIELPHRRGYLYQEGEILSPDGHCHAFDHRAQGTVFGSGGGVVVLRRLEDALEDGDPIHAVIRGSAVNNDGSSKVNYLAPSVEGQAQCMVEAYAVADVSPDTIEYIEAHGTGTYLGDPIEVAALTQAFRKWTQRKGFCWIGSVKTNIGHLDTAAGVASLIKATLALQKEAIPPSLGFERPNPTIDFESSPFRVADRLIPWPRRSSPRRAAVNSLGVGGTNAHVVLEEAPLQKPSDPSRRRYHLLVLSGRSMAALQGNTQRLAEHLGKHPEQPVADIAHTLYVGRKPLEKRRIVVCQSHEEGARLLVENDPRRVFTHTALERPELAMLFPGGGVQHVGMGRGLYEEDALFREVMDRGFALLKERHGIDLRPVMFGQTQDAASALERMSMQLPAIFLVEIALFELWKSWGVRPQALLGHSLGENAAACVGGVFSFEDALGLVVLRGRLFERLPQGGMLSVSLSNAEVAERLKNHPELDIAVLNVPQVTVVSGPTEAIQAFAHALDLDGIEHRRLPIPVAAHSRALDAVLGEFERYLRSIRLNPPEIPILSNLTGKWLSEAEAKDPAYWVAHLRQTVRFSDNLALLLSEPGRVLLECGPGRTLSSLAKQHPQATPNLPAIPSMRHKEEEIDDECQFLTALGRLWASGVPIDWSRMYPGERRLRVELPTYAFQHKRYFIEASAELPAATPSEELLKRSDIRDWGHRPVWLPSGPPRRAQVSSQERSWLFFADRAGLADRLARLLRDREERVFLVREGDAYGRRGDEFVLAPERGQEGYRALLRDLVRSGMSPRAIAHFWLLTPDESHRPGSSFFHHVQERGFYSLFFLTQALIEEGLPFPERLIAISNGALAVDGSGIDRPDEPLPYPEKATILGPIRVIPHELPPIKAQLIDVELPIALTNGSFWNGSLFQGKSNSSKGRIDEKGLERLAIQLLHEFQGEAQNGVIALRSDGRFVLSYEPLLLEPSPTLLEAIPEGAPVLITGGLGGLGLTFARALAQKRRTPLVLVGRSELPERKEWEAYIRRHGRDDRVSQRIAALLEIEAMGVPFLVEPADITVEAEVEEVLRTARARFGRIEAVIHAAGVIRDALIPTKTQADCEEVFAPKIQGTLVLERALESDPPALMVLFSSNSAIVGPPGQIDYAAANAFVDAFAISRSRGPFASKRTRYLSIAWGIFSDVGMAHEAIRSRVEGSGWRGIGPTEYALFEERERHSDGRLGLRGRLNPQKDWLLDEHRTASGHALVPGTGFLELFRAALREIGEGEAFAFEEAFFIRPLAVRDDEERPFRVQLKATEFGYAAEIRSRVERDGRVGWDLHAQANLLLVPMTPPSKIDLASIEKRCTTKLESDEKGLISPQEKHMRFGPRWRVLREIRWGEGEALATLSIDPRFESELALFHFHPSLLDLATGYAMELIRGYDASHLWVPVSHERIRVFRPLLPLVRSWVRVRGQPTQSDGFAEFDITITSPSGEVLIEVEGFSIRKLEGNFELGISSANASDMEVEPPPVRELSPEEERLAQDLSQGILSSEAPDALSRALSQRISAHLVVSSLDLSALIARAEREAKSAKAEKGSTTFARPHLETPYVAPRDEIERTLVHLFEELLGVDQVGIDDSFFDLGGHSLIAVRLFAAIKKSYRVEFPISILFEAPTVARIAERIRERMGSAQGTGESPGSESRQRFRHLVAMHPGAEQRFERNSSARPFFLVAGMFGNVLNLRHLAALVGRERPFYGLQARGLYGNEAPHESFEEMARAYLEEIRVVQPHGPYLLGGFSGGGIAAFEMAQMLRAQGERVALLVFLDTPVPHRPPLTPKDRLRIQLAELRAKGPAYIGEWAQKRIQWELERLNKHKKPNPELSPVEFHNERMEAAFRKALARYVLRPYDGEVVLFRPRPMPHWTFKDGTMIDKDRHYILPDNGWTPWVKRLEIQEVPGDHDSMVLEPHVRVLAKRLKRAIEAAEARYFKPLPYAEAAE